MKKMALIIMTVCMVAGLGMASANAGWYVANVKATGANGGNVFISLTDTASTPAFTNQWFILDPSQANQHLATALTAISTGIKVDVYFAESGVPPAFSTVLTMYLDNS